MRKSSKAPSRTTAFESVVQRADGRERIVETYIDFIMHNGQRKAMLSCIRDITQRKQVELELRQAKEELEQRVAERTADWSSANQALHRLTQQVIQAQENERRRIALELHDEIGQTLTAVNLNIQLLEDLVSDAEGTARLQESVRIIQLAMEQVRNLSFDLRPPMLDQFGLVPALEGISSAKPSVRSWSFTSALAP